MLTHHTFKACVDCCATSFSRCFLQLLLRSRALEITVESCVTSPLTMEQTNNLQQLLSTFIPRVDATALASSIARLAELLAEDTQSFDTTGAAQRAVHNVIGTLKSRDEAAPVAKPVSLQDRLAGGQALRCDACSGFMLLLFGVDVCCVEQAYVLALQKTVHALCR
jgi:hypothetical protein